MENLINHPWLLPLGAACAGILAINIVLTVFLAGRVYLSDRTLRKNDGSFNNSVHYWDDRGNPKIWGIVYKASLWGFTLASQPIWKKSAEDLFRNAPLDWKPMNFWQQLCFWPLGTSHYRIWSYSDNNDCGKIHISWLKYLKERNKPLSLPVEYADHIVSRRLRNVEPIAVYISKHTVVSLSWRKGCPAGYSAITTEQGDELMNVCYEFDHTLRCLKKETIWDKCVPLGDGTALFGRGILDMDTNDWLVEGSGCLYLYVKKI